MRAKPLMKYCGSCMTNIGHWRRQIVEQHNGTISTRMWIVPPTKMDQHQLMEEGYYNIYGALGPQAPGCSYVWVIKRAWA